MEKYLEKFVREIELRGLSTSTKRAYLRHVKRFLSYHKKDPQQIGLEEIKEFLHNLQQSNAKGRTTKLSPNSINGVVTGISFFYRHVLNRNYSNELPRMKRGKHNPTILSYSEVKLMIDSLHNVFWKAVIMTLYSAGLRQSELRNLKITDIDSKRMVLYIRNAKGAKDRQAILTPRVLECLRSYWKQYRIDRNKDVKSDYLFIPNKNTYDGILKKSLSHTGVAYIVKRAAEIAGIKKKFILTV